MKKKIIIGILSVLLIGILLGRFYFFSEKEDKLIDKAQKTYEKYLDIMQYENNGIGPMPGLLVVLELETDEEIEDILAREKIYDPYIYIKSNTLYKDFEKEMLKYMTKEVFEKNYSKYKNIDDYVAFCNCAGSGVMYEIKTVNYNYKKDNRYYFDIVLVDMEIYEHFMHPEEMENISEEECYVNLKVEFIKKNNRLIIAEEKYERI